MQALAIGKPAVGTRYIAEREANQEREGTNRRPLFNGERSDLTPAKANQHLTDGNGKPAKKDLRHIVISPESARAFESLGDTHEERREQFIECTRATMARFADELGVKGLRWVAGVHLNTDHPHVHILLSKDAFDAETGRRKRINHIPREWLIHNERGQVEPGQGRETGGAEAAATAAGVEPGAAKESQQAAVTLSGYQLAGRAADGFHSFNGSQVLLDRSQVRAVAEREKRVEITVSPSEIFDPRGVIEGTDRERAERDEQAMNLRLEGRTLAEYREVQTRFLIEQGYKAAAEWEGGERDEKDPRRELIVFDAEAVKDASGPNAGGPSSPGARGQETPRTNYGRLGEVFAEEVEARAFPVRQIAFHIDHSTDYTRRGLLDSRQRRPTETERQVGRWVMLEANLNGHETAASRILRTRLREEVARLDAAAVERGEGRPLAYIPARNLEDAIARNTVCVLRDDGTLAPRYHNPTKSKTDEARERVFDLQPEHGGLIYGLIAGDSNRIVVREIVTAAPAPEPEPGRSPEAGAGGAHSPARGPEGPEGGQGQGYEPQALKPGKGDWIHVTPDSRCPVCKKPDNCAVSVDGKKAYCRRVESPKQGRDGGFVHDLTKLEGYQVQEQRPTGPPVVQYERRPVEDRDRVYRKVLDALGLDERDREGLRARGLSDETITREGYVSVPRRAQANEIAERLAEEGEDLRGVPGFWRAAPGEGEDAGKCKLNLNYWYRGVMVPVKDPHGRIEGFQIRRAEVKPDEPRYVWLSSKSSVDSPKPEGTPSGAPVHFTNVEDIKARGEVILTEGSLKANVISSYLDRGVVAIAGVSVFQDDFGERLKRDVPELRRVWIAYDADANDKKEVKAALVRITGVLEKAGLEVGKLGWPGEQGKGLDDYLKHRLGDDFNSEPRDDRAEAQTRILLEVGWREEPERDAREQTPPPPLRPGMVDEATGREIGEQELVVARWLKYETADAEAGRTSPTLRQLRGEVAALDEGAERDGQPETPAVVRPEELERALRAGVLVTREELAEHQRRLDSVTLGKELTARLELTHAGEQFDRACEQGETRRYEALDVTTGRRREISARDVEQRAQVRGRRAAVERAEEVESVKPRERTQRRNDIRDETSSRDVCEHGDTLAGIRRAHADQLRALDRTLVKAYRAHDEIAPEAHGVERAYRGRGEEPPTPFISEEKLDRLHNQAVQRRDADTVRMLDAIRGELASEHGVPARDDERAGRLAGQRNVAESDLRVSQHRAEQFDKQKHNRKFEIDGEGKKWSLAEVDRESHRSEKEIEYLSKTAEFWGRGGLAANIFKQQVLGRVNPLNALRLSTLNPLYPLKHHPLVKIARVGKQVYDWHQRAKAARELAEAAANRLDRLGEIRTKLEERVSERQAELQNEVAKNTDLSNALDEIHARTAEGRATPAEPTYNKYELRRLEANAQELRSPDLLREYERAARSQAEREAERLAQQLASGKTPEEAARELAEERIKEAMREVEPTEAQAQTLRQLNQEVPTNRMEAAEQIEELTGEEAAWKQAGREAAEAVRAAGKPASPEELLKSFRESFGGRAAAREITSEARMQEAARSFEQFNEAREVTQVRYLDAAGEEQTGSLRETQPRGWMDSLKRLLYEPEEQIVKRAAIEKALEAEAARLGEEYDAARLFYDAAREVADVYRGELGAGEVLKPYFTPGEAAEVERIGGGLRPAELQQLEQAAVLTEEQARQVQYSRAVQDALEEGRVGNDPAARSAQAERDANPLERAERELAEQPELATGETPGVSGAAEATAATEVEAEAEEGLTLLL